jgi:hypothetical protein
MTWHERLQARVDAGEVVLTDTQRRMLNEARSRPRSRGAELGPLRSSLASGPLPWPAGVPRVSAESEDHAPPAETPLPTPSRAAQSKPAPQWTEDEE